jgi:hypothetical protein
VLRCRLAHHVCKAEGRVKGVHRRSQRRGPRVSSVSRLGGTRGRKPGGLRLPLAVRRSRAGPGKPGARPRHCGAAVPHGAAAMARRRADSSIVLSCIECPIGRLRNPWLCGPYRSCYRSGTRQQRTSCVVREVVVWEGVLHKKKNRRVVLRRIG